MASPIHTAESWFAIDPSADVLRIPVGRGGEFVLLPRERVAEATPIAHWQRRDVAPFLPEQQSSQTLPAFVNDSRWLVQCPCGSAQYASRLDRRFFCVECLNEWAGSHWVGVEFPDEAEAIEQTLAVRPIPHTRSWLPGETVADLEAQNAEHLAVR